jgi:hypothetical protein
MLARSKGGILQVRSVDGTFEREVALEGLNSVTSLRIDPAGRRIAVTAASGVGRAPDVNSNRRGDLRLYVIDLESGERRRLTEDYAHDAFWWPDSSRLAYHTSCGVAVVRVADAREEHRFEVGRFSWGPPSISVSPTGARVAFVKWKGDDRKLAVYDLATGAGEVFRTSCLDYAWWKDDVIAYDRGQSIKRFDVTTGKTREWLSSKRILPGAEALDELLPGAREILTTNQFDFPQLGEPRLTRARFFGGRVYAHLALANRTARLTAVVSVTEEGRNLKVHAASGGARALRDFMLLDGAQTIAVSFEEYEAARITGRGLVYVGPHADSIPAGFGPLARLAAPEFGFHALPG